MLRRRSSLHGVLRHKRSEKSVSYGAEANSQPLLANPSSLGVKTISTFSASPGSLKQLSVQTPRLVWLESVHGFTWVELSVKSILMSSPRPQQPPKSYLLPSGRASSDCSEKRGGNKIKIKIALSCGLVSFLFFFLPNSTKALPLSMLLTSSIHNTTPLPALRCFARHQKNPQSKKAITRREEHKT